MENYNWIKAVAISNGKQVEVRQGEPGGRLWIDKDGTMYNFADLDFTQVPELPDFIKNFEENNKRFAEQQAEHQELMNKILSSLDANAIADHKAAIDERAYWRKLRCEIYMKVMESYSPDQVDTGLNRTKHVINKLYEQDRQFFVDKKQNEIKEMALSQQAKQEWSEEDEKGLGDALWCCKQAASIAKDENDMGNAWYAENWLKSLKERVGCEADYTTKWRPTEEQLEALYEETQKSNRIKDDRIVSLYNDLKNL